MVVPVEDLRVRWLDLCGRLRIDGDAASLEFEQLRDAHTEPHRHYHDLSHLAECFVVVDGMVDLGPVDRALVELAIWFHDAIYDPQAADNEPRSAEAARRWLAMVGRGDLAGAVGELIEMTAGHEVGSPTAAASALHDADLAVLGAPEPRYKQYCAQVRREYGHLDDATFARGRSRVLRGFLAAERIYLRPDVVHEREPRARSNMTAELGRLAR